MKRMRNEYDFIADVSCSTDKLIFMYQAIKNRKEIAAHVFNDVFCEFEETFYKGKPYKNAMANFKKYMRLSAENKGHKVVVLPAKNNGIIHGIKNLWSIEYCNKKANTRSCALAGVSNNKESVCDCCEGLKGWLDEDGPCICPQCKGTGKKLD